MSADGVRSFSERLRLKFPKTRLKVFILVLRTRVTRRTRWGNLLVHL